MYTVILVFWLYLEAWAPSLGQYEAYWNARKPKHLAEQEQIGLTERQNIPHKLEQTSLSTKKNYEYLYEPPHPLFTWITRYCTQLSSTHDQRIIVVARTPWKSMSVAQLLILKMRKSRGVLNISEADCACTTSKICERAWTWKFSQRHSTDWILSSAKLSYRITRIPLSSLFLYVHLGLVD